LGSWLEFRSRYHSMAPTTPSKLPRTTRRTTTAHSAGPYGPSIGNPNNCHPTRPSIGIAIIDKMTPHTTAPTSRVKGGLRPARLAGAPPSGSFAWNGSLFIAVTVSKSQKVVVGTSAPRYHDFQQPAVGTWVQNYAATRGLWPEDATPPARFAPAGRAS